MIELSPKDMGDFRHLAYTKKDLTDVLLDLSYYDMWKSLLESLPLETLVTGLGFALDYDDTSLEYLSLFTDHRGVFSGEEESRGLVLHVCGIPLAKSTTPCWYQTFLRATLPYRTLAFRFVEKAAEDLPANPDIDHALHAYQRFLSAYLLGGIDWYTSWNQLYDGAWSDFFSRLGETSNRWNYAWAYDSVSKTIVDGRTALAYAVGVCLSATLPAFECSLRDSRLVEDHEDYARLAMQFCLLDFLFDDRPGFVRYDEFIPRTEQNLQVLYDQSKSADGLVKLLG